MTRRLLCWLAILAGCGGGKLGEGRRLEIDGGQTTPLDGSRDGSVGFDADLDGGLPDALPVDTGPIGLGGATVGDRCTAGVTESFIVFSVDPPECAAHGQAIEDRGPGGTIHASLTPPTQFPAQLTLPATACFSGACAPTTLELNLTRFSMSSGAAGTYEVTLPDGTPKSGPLDAAWCDYPAGNPPLATGIRVVEVSIYQAVKVPLVQNAAPVTNRNAPVVVGRPGVVRVFVEIDPGFRARPIVARLELTRGAMPPTVLETQRVIDRSSIDPNFMSTLDFELDGAMIAADTQWSVTLYENDACTSAPGSSAGGRYPAQGDLALDAESTNGGLEIVLVPIRYNADGSGRLPDTSQSMLDRYRTAIWRLYPISDLTITVRAPLDWDQAITADGGGWPELISGVLSLRSADQAPRDTYYYGLIAPGATIADYCPDVCIGGLSMLPGPSDEQARGAAGLGFDRLTTFDTFAHEIGHANGRPHSGCMTPDSDPNYPYPEGQDGVWGYDITDQGYKAPAIRDVMSYCLPSWISDYTYRELFDRIQAVNLMAAIRPSPGTWRTAIADGFGLRAGRPFEVQTQPRGRPVSARFRSPDGGDLGPATVVRVPFAEGNGQMFWIAPEPAGAVAVELEGFGRLSLD